jgi:predicted nuclease of predicted toxin-antitoxin system
MRFLIDAQLSPVLADWLRSLGHDAEHVADVLGQMAPDREIVARAKAIASIIVSKDHDFVSLLEGREGAPALVLVLVGNAANRFLLARFELAWARVEAELLSGRAVVEID